jgi:hypothetical protein
MDLEAFWALVERSRETNPRSVTQADYLCDLVSGLEPAEIRVFVAIFRALTTRATRWDIWGAGYVLDGGMSNDSFKDFISWLTSQGRDVYEATLADPDSLAAVPGIERGEYHSAENFAGIQFQILDLAFGTPPPDEEWANIFALEGAYLTEQEWTFSELSPGGERWEEDDLDTRYPRLTRLWESRERALIETPTTREDGTPSIFVVHPGDDDDRFIAYVNGTLPAVAERNGEAWLLKDLGDLGFEPISLPGDLADDALADLICDTLHRWISDNQPDLPDI